jgi:hypothetical protein
MWARYFIDVRYMNDIIWPKIECPNTAVDRMSLKMFAVPRDPLKRCIFDHYMNNLVQIGGEL